MSEINILLKINFYIYLASNTIKYLLRKIIYSLYLYLYLINNTCIL